MIGELPGKTVATTIEQANLPNQIFSFLTVASPILLSLGFLLVVISLLQDRTKTATIKPKIVGAYNPAFDPFAKKKGTDYSFTLQVAAIILIVLGVLPIVINYVV